MKHKPLLISVILSLMIASCQKQNRTEGLPGQQPFLQEAIQFLQTQASEPLLATLNTHSPNLVQYQGKPVAVRVYPIDDLSSNRFIVLYKKDGRFTGHWVDLSALNKASADEYEGTVSLLDLKDRLITRYTIRENKVSGIYNAAEGQYIPLDIPSLSTPDNREELDPFVVTPRRNANDRDYYSIYWIFNQDEAYDQSYMPKEQDMRDGGSNSTTEMEVAPVFAGPDHPIKDIKEELKCFTIDSKAVYSVTVNVNQPVPNTRFLMEVGSAHSVGHVYLTLQEQLPDGNLIIRNVGFYPKNYAKPGSEVDESSFGDDSKTAYSVSLNMPISDNEFKALRMTLISQQDLDYNLSKFNCTTSVISALNSVNIHLPSTIGYNGIFRGNDPGDLGQDIRGLDLDNFSSENGGRKMIRTVSSNNKSLPSPRTGNCK